MYLDDERDGPSSHISISIVENAGNSTENSVYKTTHYPVSALVLDEHVLPVMEQALRGFGYAMDGRELVVDGGEDEDYYSSVGRCLEEELEERTRQLHETEALVDDLRRKNERLGLQLNSALNHLEKCEDELEKD